MVDLWQAIVLLAAGWLLGLGAGYVQRWWSKSDTLEAEERQATRRLAEEEREAGRKAEEEERQARRLRRRERVAQIAAFIDVARQYTAREFTATGLEQAYQQNLIGIKDKLSLEEFRKAMRKSPSLGGPDFYQLARALQVAVAASPTTEIWGQVMAVFKVSCESKNVGGLWTSIQSLEKLLEDYVTKV